MGTSFAVGDKVKIVGELEEYVGKMGEIIKDGGFPNIRVGFRKLGEGIKGRKSMQHHWVIMLDDAGQTIVLPEGNLEKTS